MLRLFLANHQDWKEEYSGQSDNTTEKEGKAEGLDALHSPLEKTDLGNGNFEYILMFCGMQLYMRDVQRKHFFFPFYKYIGIFFRIVFFFFSIQVGELSTKYEYKPLS